MATEMTVTIALAQRADFAAVDALIREAYAFDYGPGEQHEGEEGATSNGRTATREGDPPNVDPMQSAARRAEQFDVWVARDQDGTLVGSVTTRRPGGASLHEDALPHELDLRLLGVSPAARRRGIAAQLMQHVADRARDAGFSGVFLKTAPHMTPAHRLYDALGFTRVPERDGLWIGGVKQFDLYTYVMPLTVLVR